MNFKIKHIYIYKEKKGKCTQEKKMRVDITFAILKP